MLHESILDPSASILRGLPLPADRVAQSGEGFKLPEGTVVVSSDGHWSTNHDIFQERAPAHMRDRMPKMIIDEEGFHDWHINGKSIAPPTAKRPIVAFETTPGCMHLEPRLADLDAEGITHEIVFGNLVPNLFLSWPDQEVREWIFRIYNQYIAETGAQSGGRFHGVGLINYWDMDKVHASIDELNALGLKTLLLPIAPRGANGAEFEYASPTHAPLWSAIEDSGLPVCFHVGEVFKEGVGGQGIGNMLIFGPFRKTLGELIFGGILDRHPKLQVVFTEADINWIPGALQTADMIVATQYDMLDIKIKHSPRYYWQNNCYATFMWDPAGLKLIDDIGTDRVMWCSDYPHVESVLGKGWSSMQAVCDAVSEDDARAILGGTAMKLFKLR